MFFGYIGFDAISTAAEETKDPQRNMPIGVLGSLGVCTVIYAIVRLVATGSCPTKQLKGSDPLARAFEVARIGWGQAIISLGAVISMTAVLLVFQLGQPRIFFSMSRDGLLPRVVPLGAREVPHAPNIGTLFAFMVVCLGGAGAAHQGTGAPAAVPRPLRVARGARPRARVPYVMWWLPRSAWIRFGIWMAFGAAIYFLYGVRYSRLARPREPGPPR